MTGRRQNAKLNNYNKNGAERLQKRLEFPTIKPFLNKNKTY